MTSTGYKGKVTMDAGAFYTPYMPLDSLNSYDFYARALPPVLRFAILPKTCAISGTRIWLKNGYMFIRDITGPGEPVIEYRWHDVKEHLFWQLTR